MQLFGVVKNNDGEGTQRLLEKGADVNVADAFKITPLMIAAEKGYEELCAMLLAHGANVDHMDGTERTALGVAALNNHAAVVKLLIRAGADAVLAVACLTNVLQGAKGKKPSGIWCSDRLAIVSTAQHLVLYSSHQASRSHSYDFC